MTNLLLIPPIAFLVYFVLVSILTGLGRIMAKAASPNPLKSSTYASGEQAEVSKGVPGYRPFFITALFFAVLHLGVLMLGSSDLTMLSMVYVFGLLLVLIALILG